MQRPNNAAHRCVVRFYFDDLLARVFVALFQPITRQAATAGACEPESSFSLATSSTANSVVGLGRFSAQCLFFQPSVIKVSPIVQENLPNLATVHVQNHYRLSKLSHKKTFALKCNVALYSLD